VVAGLAPQFRVAAVVRCARDAPGRHLQGAGRSERIRLRATLHAIGYAAAGAWIAHVHRPAARCADAIRRRPAPDGGAGGIAARQRSLNSLPPFILSDFGASMMVTVTELGSVPKFFTTASVMSFM